jgi:hypothetical protein
MKYVILAIQGVALIALLSMGAVMAQEPTAEPTEQAPVEVEVTEGESATVETPDAEITVNSEATNPDYYTLIVGVAAALFGVLAGGGGVAVIFARANKNVGLKDSTEELLSKSVPQSVIDDAHRIANRTLDILESIGKPAITFVRDVTDGLPNTQAQG